MNLVKIFGSPGKVKVISFFLEYTEPVVMWDIVKATHTSYSLLKNFVIPELLKQKIIVLERKVGNNKFYRINLNSSDVKSMLKLMRKKDG